MAGNVPLPRSRTNPVGRTRNIRKAYSAWVKQTRKNRNWLLKLIDDIPKEVMEINSSVPGYILNARRYDYLLSTAELNAYIRELMQRTSEPAPANATWREIQEAYEAGTADEVVNLQAITAGTTQVYDRPLTEVLRSRPYERRIALIRARVFEEMEGFQRDTGNDLARVLRDGIENGLNPREVKKTIRKRFNVSLSRSERIARTEITQAYRRARLDEDQDAQQRLGIRTGLLWLSALSPTTRQSHAAKHGQVLTQEQVRDFYSVDGNSIQCKCGQVSVLLDEDGSPRNQKQVEKVRAQR